MSWALALVGMRLYVGSCTAVIVAPGQAVLLHGGVCMVQQGTELALEGADRSFRVSGLRALPSGRAVLTFGG